MKVAKLPFGIESWGDKPQPQFQPQPRLCWPAGTIDKTLEVEVVIEVEVQKVPMLMCHFS